MPRGRIALRSWTKPQVPPDDSEPLCLWCSAKLRPNTYGTDKVHLGPYWDNAFCTLRCGYAFGVEAASRGVRL